MKICKCGHLNCNHSVRYMPLRYGKCKKCDCKKFENEDLKETNKEQKQK